MNAKKSPKSSPSASPRTTHFSGWGIVLKKVSYLKYSRGSWVSSAEQNPKERAALAWRALNGMNGEWKLSIPHHIKIMFFQATVS